MEKLVCPKCGRVIEGFSKKHVDWQMMQHQNWHRNHDKHAKRKK